MPAERPTPVLVLMAKRPAPGRVKTRLMPELNAGQAAQVAAALIEFSARLAVHAWDGPVHLLGWPDLEHDIFTEISDTTGIHLGIQVPGSLGDKMSAAICGFTDRGISAAVMGCDTPHCPPDQLRRAHRCLESGGNVIGPVDDGGYYLIGLQNCEPRLFSGIRWGGPDVLHRTMERAARLGIEFQALDRLQDIDDYADLVAATDRVPALGSWLKS